MFVLNFGRMPFFISNFRGSSSLKLIILCKEFGYVDTFIWCICRYWAHCTQFFTQPSEIFIIYMQKFLGSMATFNKFVQISIFFRCVWLEDKNRGKFFINEIHVYNYTWSLFMGNFSPFLLLN